MFARSTILISPHSYFISKIDSWDNTYFGLHYLSQESMVLSQLELAYLYYLNLSCSLTKLGNYNLCVPWLIGITRAVS